MSSSGYSSITLKCNNPIIYPDTYFEIENQSLSFFADVAFCLPPTNPHPSDVAEATIYCKNWGGGKTGGNQKNRERAHHI